MKRVRHPPNLAFSKQLIEYAQTRYKKLELPTSDQEKKITFSEDALKEMSIRSEELAQEVARHLHRQNRIKRILFNPYFVGCVFLIIASLLKTVSYTASDTLPYEKLRMLDPSPVIQTAN